MVAPVIPSYVPPALWDGTTTDMRPFSTITLSIITAAATAYTPQWSPDKINWFPMSGLDLNFNTQATIGTTFTGPLTFQGGGYVRLNGGTGGTFMLSGGQ